MKSVKEFFAEEVREYWRLNQQVAKTHGPREAGKRAVFRFLEDLRIRMEDLIRVTPPEDVAETVVGWFYEISSAVHEIKDKDGSGSVPTLDFEFFTLDGANPNPKGLKKWAKVEREEIKRGRPKK